MGFQENTTLPSGNLIVTIEKFPDVDVLMIRSVPGPISVELAQRFRLHDGTDPNDLEEIVRSSGSQIRAVLTSGVRGADAGLLARLPNLEIISSISAGLDGIDLDYARARNIIVTNTSRALYNDVADTAIALLLGVTRRFFMADRFVRRRRWSYEEFPLTVAVAGKTMGILGLGAIGREIARRAEAMGMNVVYTNRRARSDVSYAFVATVSELAMRSDILVVSCPGGDETRHLVNEAVLSTLGPHGYVVNIARGTVIDETALVAALVEGRIAGAGLDVFEDEPRVPAKLLELDNVVLLPHIGSGTEETRAAMLRLAVDNLIEHCAGRPVLTPIFN